MANVFELQGLDLTSEVMECLVSTEYIRIERIVSNGQCSPDGFWYDQTEHEWVVLLSGAATIEFDAGRTVSLKPGDYLNIPAHKKHRVAETALDAQTLWLAVFYT